jgi:biotin operon repressor
MDQPELFPVIERKVRKRTFLREYIAATREHGPLATQGQIAAALGISRQRINELVRAQRIATVNVDGRDYVPCSSLELFLTEERRVGRPHARQPKLLEIMAAGLEA